MSDQNKKICTKFFWLVLAIIILQALAANIAAGADIYLQNQRKGPITFYSNGFFDPITLQPDSTAKIPMPIGSLSIWSCNMGDSECINNTQNLTATVARLDIRADINYYWLSTELGFNFAMTMMPLGGTGCPTITCKANLEQCPHELEKSSSNGAGFACKPPPESTEPDSPLRDKYSSLFADSDCQMPCSSDDPYCIPDDSSSNSKPCSALRDLVVIVTDG